MPALFRLACISRWFPTRSVAATVTPVTPFLALRRRALRLAASNFLPALLVALVGMRTHLVHAAPILSFESVQVVADGVNPTPVSIVVKVDNTSGPALNNLQALWSQLIWTASGGFTDADLSTIANDGTASSAGMLFAATNPFFFMDGGSAEPKGWSVYATSGSPLTLGTSGPVNVATLNFLVAPGFASGQFQLDFVTGDIFNNAFGTLLDGSYLYANGNNGTTTGVITVTAVPEPSTYAMALAGLACGFSMWRRRKRARRHEANRISTRGE